jgi:lipopolysaccharide export system protein LptA
MDVFLTADNAVQRVEAIGNVVIRELGTAKKATAGKGVYDMTEDTVVLTESPYLEELDQGFFTRGADRIIYYRSKQQFKAEGENVQIEFGVKSDGAHRPADLLRPKEDTKDAAPGKPENPAP